MPRKQSQKRKDRWEYFAWAVLAFLVVFHAINNYVVLKQDTVYFQGDPLESYISTVRFLREFSQQPLFGKIKFFYTYTGDIHPPLFGTISALFMAVFGVNQDVAVLTNIPFLIVLLASTYLLGKKLFNREIALISSVLLSFFPAFFSLSRAYMSDFSVAAMVTLSLLLLVRSEYMVSRRWALLFGIVVGLTALTQPYFSLFFIGPVVICVCIPLAQAILRQDVARIKRMLVSLSLVAIVALLIAAPWYLIHSANYFEIQGCRTTLIRESSGQSLLSTFLHFNLASVLASSLLAPMAGCFFLALVYFLLRCKRHRGFILSWLLLPYLVFISLGLRYNILLQLLLFSTLPAVAFVIAFSTHEILLRLPFMRLGTPKSRIHLVVFFIIFMGASIFFFVTYGAGGDLLDVRGKEPVEFNSAIMRLNYLGRIVPHEMAFITDDVIGQIMTENSNHTSKIFLINPLGTVSSALIVEFNTAATYRDINVQFSDCLCAPSHGCVLACWLNESDCMEKLEAADYVILEPIIQSSQDYGVWWDIDDETYFEQIVPLVRNIRESLVDYSVLEVVPYALSSRQTYVGEEASFGWLNESAWVLKKTA